MIVNQNRHGLELVKADVFGSIPAVLLNLGLDAGSVIDGARLCPEIFRDPENVIPFMGLGRLMCECVKRTGCKHFGLLVGQKATTRSLGLVGLLVEHSPNVFDALENLVRYLYLQDGCGVPSVEVMNGTVLLGYRIVETSVPGALEIVDAAVAARFNIMRRLCGKSWRPIEVALPRPKPQSTRMFDSFFEVPVQFGEEQGAIIFSAEWSLRSVPGADPMIRNLVEERISELDRQMAGRFETQLRRFVRTLVLTRHCSLTTVARQFGMEPRSLARRLEREGIEFRGVVDEVRYEMAQHLIAKVSLPIAQVATILGYSEASAFTRAFRRWSTTTPKLWRAGQPS